MTSLPPDRDPATRPALSLDELPPELEGIQHDLLADATEWVRRVPPSARFNQRLRAVLPLDEADDATASAQSPRETRTVHYVPHPQHAHSPHPTRLGTVLALVATVAVVALLAAVFATLHPGGMATKTTTRPGTPTPTLPAPGPITTLPLRATYAGQPGIPVVAVSNPNVIYEFSDSTSTPVLRRSDDGGASWHVLAYPSAPGAFVSNLLLAVNPADAANVFLQVALGYFPGQAGACRPVTPGEKSVVCIGEYVSTDSGAHWSLMRYPVPGTLFPNGTFLDYDNGIVQAQGDRVYAALQYHNTEVQPASEVRILSSADHGMTWQLADTALAQQGLHICDFVPAPTGATLFARTAAVCQGSGFTSRQLWRSDDAGAHWRQVTPFAAPFNTIFNSFTVASTPAAEGNQLIIYDGTQNQQTNVVTYYASLDGGMSWQPAPTTGLPAGAEGVWLPMRMGDGSLVVAFTTSASPVGPSPTAASTAGPTPTPSPTPEAQQAPGHSITCYAWRPGSARWMPLTQPIAIGTLMPMNIFTTNGAQRVVTLTLYDSASGNPTYTIERFA